MVTRPPKEEWIEKGGQYVPWLQLELLTICDHDGKPVNIDLHIGKRPVLAAGDVRTGGDIEMLRYCQQRKDVPTEGSAEP